MTVRACIFTYFKQKCTPYYMQKYEIVPQANNIIYVLDLQGDKKLNLLIRVAVK